MWTICIPGFLCIGPSKQTHLWLWKLQQLNCLDILQIGNIGQTSLSKYKYYILGIKYNDRNYIGLYK